MNRILTTIIVAFGVLVFAIPATAQVTTMGPTACLICNPECPFIEEHTDFNHPSGPWSIDGWHGLYCAWGSCDDLHPRCGGARVSAEDLKRQERINEILNTMEGDMRVVALVNEFPEHVYLTIGGEALEVFGAACDEAKMVGRINVTLEQAVAVIDAKSDARLAAKF